MPRSTAGTPPSQPTCRAGCRTSHAIAPPPPLSLLSPPHSHPCNPAPRRVPYLDGGGGLVHSLVLDQAHAPGAAVAHHDHGPGEAGGLFEAPGGGGGGRWGQQTRQVGGCVCGPGSSGRYWSMSCSRGWEPPPDRRGCVFAVVVVVFTPHLGKVVGQGVRIGVPGQVADEQLVGGLCTCEARGGEQPARAQDGRDATACKPSRRQALPYARHATLDARPSPERQHAACWKPTERLVAVGGSRLLSHSPRDGRVAACKPTVYASSRFFGTTNISVPLPGTYQRRR